MASTLTPVSALLSYSNYFEKRNVLSAQPETEVHFGSEFHVDGLMTASARPPCVTRTMWTSVDGRQKNGDDVMMQSQRLVPSVPPDTVEQCRPGISAASCRVCT